jgi:hypothetical protein
MKKAPWRDSSKYYNDIVDDDLLQAARYFRDVQDNTPEKFASIANHCGIDLRTAEAWAQIGRTFGDLGIDEKRLSAIGWTKLQIVASYINRANCEELLTIAETSSAQDVALLMRGVQPAKGAKVVVLYLKAGQYKIFSQTVLAHGAKKIGSGLVNKERALISALSKIELPKQTPQ